MLPGGGGVSEEVEEVEAQGPSILYLSLCYYVSSAARSSNDLDWLVW